MNNVFRAKNTIFANFAVILVFFLSASADAKEFYRWKDEKGVLHFTDKPPRDTQYESVKAENRASDDEDQAEQEAKSALKDPEKCKAEKARLNILKNNKSIQMKSRDGSVRSLTPEEIKTEMKATEKAVKVFC